MTLNKKRNKWHIIRLSIQNKSNYFNMQNNFIIKQDKFIYRKLIELIKLLNNNKVIREY